MISMSVTRLPLVIGLSGIAIGTLAVGLTAAAIMQWVPLDQPSEPELSEPAVMTPSSDSAVDNEPAVESNRSNVEPEPTPPNHDDDLSHRLPLEARALLITATHARKLEIVRSILLDDATLGQWRYQPREIKTLVLIAIERNQPELLQAFIDAGADLNEAFDWTVSERENQPAERLNSCSALSLAAYLGELELLQIMIQSGAEPWPADGPLPAISAVQGGHREVVDYLLTLSPSPPWTELMRAAISSDQPRMIDWLVRAGAPLVLPEEQPSFVALAIEHRHPRVLDRLLRHKAPIAHEDLLAARRTKDEAIKAAIRRHGHAIDMPSG